MQGAAAGVMLGSAMLAWYPDPYEWDIKNTRRPRALGLSYFLSGIKRPVLYGSLVCATYSGVECVMEQLRDESKSSTWVNSAAAGAASGMVMASMTGRFDVMASTALGLGILMGMVEYNGQNVAVDPEHASRKWDGILPPRHKDSEVLQELKKKYPEYKDL